MPVATATRTADVASTAVVRPESLPLAREPGSLAWLMRRSHLRQVGRGARGNPAAGTHPYPFCESISLSSVFA